MRRNQHLFVHYIYDSFTSGIEYKRHFRVSPSSIADVEKKNSRQAQIRQVRRG